MFTHTSSAMNPNVMPPMINIPNASGNFISPQMQHQMQQQMQHQMQMGMSPVGASMSPSQMPQQTMLSPQQAMNHIEHQQQMLQMHLMQEQLKFQQQQFAASMQYNTGMMMNKGNANMEKSPIVSNNRNNNNKNKAEEEEKPDSKELYKTELCRKFMTTGFCRYGDKCQFAHGHHELRSTVKHRLYKTIKCKRFQQTGHCPYGTRCRFIHDEDDMELATVPRGVPAVNTALPTNEIPLSPSLNPSSNKSTPTSAAKNPVISPMQLPPTQVQQQQSQQSTKDLNTALGSMYINDNATTDDDTDRGSIIGSSLGAEMHRVPSAPANMMIMTGRVSSINDLINLNSKPNMPTSTMNDLKYKKIQSTNNLANFYMLQQQLGYNTGEDDTGSVVSQSIFDDVSSVASGNNNSRDIPKVQSMASLNLLQSYERLDGGSKPLGQDSRNFSMQSIHRSGSSSNFFMPNQLNHTKPSDIPVASSAMMDPVSGSDSLFSTKEGLMHGNGLHKSRSHPLFGSMPGVNSALNIQSSQPSGSSTNLHASAAAGLPLYPKKNGTSPPESAQSGISLLNQGSILKKESRFGSKLPKAASVNQLSSFSNQHKSSSSSNLTAESRLDYFRNLSDNALAKNVFNSHVLETLNEKDQPLPEPNSADSMFNFDDDVDEGPLYY